MIVYPNRATSQGGQVGPLDQQQSVAWQNNQGSKRKQVNILSQGEESHKRAQNSSAIILPAIKPGPDSITLSGCV